MKFLVLAKPRIEAPVPEERLASSREAKAIIEAALASGQFDCAYQFVTGGGIAIVNANTTEELWDGLSAYPLYEQCEWHIKPLVDIGYVFDKTAERIPKTDG